MGMQSATLTSRPDKRSARSSVPESRPAIVGGDRTVTRTPRSFASLPALAPDELQSAHPRLQAKLSVSHPENAFEQEADRVADQVMRMPESVTRVATRSAPVVQRMCSTCEEELHRSEQAA